jgi:hypothetical protein
VGGEPWRVKFVFIYSESEEKRKELMRERKGCAALLARRTTGEKKGRSADRVLEDEQ